ncbi:hypothetical protein L1887_20950 [Cichorium endivia]|nr:hypothetical protein L1887_20950 [Cichorium endivia]
MSRRLTISGGLFNTNHGQNNGLQFSEFAGGNGFTSKEELRAEVEADATYLSYYYSNDNNYSSQTPNDVRSGLPVAAPFFLQRPQAKDPNRLDIGEPVPEYWVYFKRTYKEVGAPLGSVIVGTKSFIARARSLRKNKYLISNSEMDYHSMKRSELQAVCKEHKIRANSANSVLIDELSKLLDKKQKPKARQRTCLKNSVETIDESDTVVSKRQAKKVTFSPEVEYERSGKKQKAMEPVVTETKDRRKSMAKKVDKPVVDNVNTLTDDDVQILVKGTRSRTRIVEKNDVIPTNERKKGRRAVKDVEKETDVVKEPEGNLGKVTRSRVQTVEKDDVLPTNERKRGRRSVQEVEKETDAVKEPEVNPGKVTRSKANIVGKDVQADKDKQSKRAVKDIEKEKSEPVVGRARVTRSKAPTLTEDSKEPDLSPEVKKTRGRRTEKDVEKVDPFKEVKDVPVRATRSRAQTSNNDSVVADPPVEKKRTRRDASVVADPPVEKKRTRRDTIVAEVPETQDNADKGTRQSRRNKVTVEETTVVNQNESKVEIVTEKKVTRSKAPVAKKPSGGKGKSKGEVQQLEEPSEPAVRRIVNRRKSVIQPKETEVVLPLEEPPAKKDTRRKSVVPKAQGKGSKKPLVGKKETEMPQSPNVKARETVGKKQSKNASENETKEEASASGSKKSRKRRGEPVIEDETIETEPVSTRKSSVKKEKADVVKTPASRTGAKRAKLSGIKQSDSKDTAGKSDTVETPVSKMASLELDEKVVETEKTPAIDESGKRFTRVARSERKEPGQSSIKDQSIVGGRLSSRKTPGRSTRKGIKVDEKQVSESSHESQPLVDVQMASPEDAGVKPGSDMTSPFPSEASKEAEGQILEQPGDLSALESVRSPTKAIEENVISINEDAGHVPTEDASGVESHQVCNGSDPGKDEISSDETPSATDVLDIETAPFPIPEVAESTTEIFGETQVLVAGNSEKSNMESAIPEVSEKAMELTSEGMQNDDVVEDALVSAVKTVVLEESVDISVEQSDIKGKSEEIEASIVEGVNQFIADGEAQAQINADEDEVDNKDDIQEPPAGDDKIQGLGMEENDVEDESKPEEEFDVVEVKKEPAIVLESSTAKELESDVDEISILGKSDDEDNSVGATNKEYETDPMRSSGDGEGEGEGLDSIKEHESNTKDQDGETEQEQPTSHYCSAMEDQDVGENEAEPGQNEDVPESSTKSPDREQGSAVSNEERTEEAELATEDDHALVDEKPTIEEENLPEATVDGLVTDQLPGAYASPNTEDKPPGDDNMSEPPTSFKDEDRNKQEDLGSYSFGTDDFQKPASANECDGVGGQSTEDNHVSGLQTSSPAPANSTQEFVNWTDSTLKALLNTPTAATTAQVSHVKDRQQSTVRFTLPDEGSPNDTDGNTTQNPDSALKALFTTPTTAQVSHVRERGQSTVRFTFPDEDETEGDGTESPDLSLKSSLKTPATTQHSFVKDTQKSTVTFSLMDEDDKKGNTAQHPDSSLKALFTTSTTTQEDSHPSTVRFTLPNEDSSLKTPAISRVSRVIDRQETPFRFAIPDEDDTEDKPQQDPDSSLKALFKTPATTRVSHIKDRGQSAVGISLPDEDDTEGNATQNQDSSLKALFKTPATTQISHVKDQKQSAVRFAIPDEDDAEGNVTEYPDSSLKGLFATPATTQVSQKNIARFALPDEGSAPQNSDLSLKRLFTTPATAQVSHANGSHQSTVRFMFPVDTFDQGSNVDQANATNQNEGLGEYPKGETFGVDNFQEFSRNYFGDEQVDDGSGDYSGKDQLDDQRQDNPGLIKEPKSQTFEDFAYRYFGDDPMDEEAPETSHHPASGFNDTGELETQPKGLETGDQGRREM